MAEIPSPSSLIVSLRRFSSCVSAEIVIFPSVGENLTARLSMRTDADEGLATSRHGQARVLYAAAPYRNARPVAMPEMHSGRNMEAAR